MGFFDFLKRKELAEIEALRGRVAELSKYERIADVDAEIANKISKAEETLSSITIKCEAKESDSNARIKELEEQINELSSKYTAGLATYNELRKQIAIYTESLELADFGVYEPHFDFDTPDKYKEAILSVRDKQKDMFPDRAAVGGEGISWNNSLAQGQVMVRGIKKIMLRAFNGECDSFIANVDWNNITKMEERIRKSWEVINKAYQRQDISISERYMQLKIEELRLAFEYKLKKHQEKEEQRAIREQMREEEKAQREIEAALAKAEKEKETYERALEKAREEVSAAEGKKQEQLQSKIEELEARLKDAESNKDRALSMAQQTRRGHVYVISNIGSFGEDVYKIGMTRRLDPLDRVRELGDASVPFPFDVHAIIFSEDAPTLESTLHKAFEAKRVNQVNLRKEFFNVSIDEIEAVVHKNNATIEFTKVAEARDYRESMAKRIKADATSNGNTSAFPTSLFS